MTLVRQHEASRGQRTIESCPQDWELEGEALDTKPTKSEGVLRKRAVRKGLQEEEKKTVTKDTQPTDQIPAKKKTYRSDYKVTRTDQKIIEFYQLLNTFH